ncbi:phage distal tail protein, partial [Streptococcus suis]
LDSFYYRKDHVSVAKDIPNRYPIGSTVVIDCEDDTIIVDGMDRFGDRIQGSSWLKIPPGESELEIYCSSWIRNKPTVSIQFEERYL